MAGFFQTKAKEGELKSPEKMRNGGETRLRKHIIYFNNY